MRTINVIYLRSLLAILFAFFLPEIAWAEYGPPLQPGTVFDGITNTFKNSSAGWMTAAQGYAQNLFLSLAAIEFTWAAAQLTLKKGELQDIIASTMMKVVGIGFFYSLLMMAPTWIPAIMDSFGMAGARVGANGGSAAMLSPSGIFDQGIDVASAMVSAMNSANSNNLGIGEVITSGGASIGSFMFGAIVTGLAGLLTILAFTLVAVQLMVTLIESYLVIGGGMLMLGFTGSRWTLPFGEKYFGYAVSTGIKLFTLYLIVGQGQNVANAIIQGLTSGGTAPGPVDFLGAGASSLAYGAMGYLVPSLAGSMMNGSPSLSMGNMAAAGGGIAGTMVGGAAALGSTALSGMSAASGLFNKTTSAAGNIGGDTPPPGPPGGPGGGIGGNSPTTSGGVSGGANAAGFGGGSESSVAAPPGMDVGAGKPYPSTPAAQPVPAPAAMALTSMDAPSPAAASPEMSLNTKPTEPSPTAADPTNVDDGAKQTRINQKVESSAATPPNTTPSLNVSAKGGTDAIASTKQKSLKDSLDKGAQDLNDMAKRMDRLPVNDGHAGGINVRFNLSD